MSILEKLGFKKPSTQPTAEPTVNEPPLDKNKPSSKKVDYYYTVGTSKDGGVVLILNDRFETTLAMDTAATKQLIKMLETALPENCEVENDAKKLDDSWNQAIK